jgi:hypothetical protein
MSFENRHEDVVTLMSLPVGGTLGLNMFQEGGASVERTSEMTFMLSEIPLYGGIERPYGSFHVHQLPRMVDIIYDEFT